MTIQSVEAATQPVVDEDAETPEVAIEHGAAEADSEPTTTRWVPARAALVAGILILATLAALTGFLGFRNVQSHRTGATRAEFLQVARQGAVNLTTIDWQHADADVRRILDSATGMFYENFAKRAQPFIDVVKQAQSKSEGTVVAAGLESVTDDAARVLVAMSVKTVNLGAQETTPRAWRMRIDVQRKGNDLKVSDVEFVP